MFLNKICAPPQKPYQVLNMLHTLSTYWYLICMVSSTWCKEVLQHYSVFSVSCLVFRVIVLRCCRGGHPRPCRPVGTIADARYTHTCVLLVLVHGATLEQMRGASGRMQRMELICRCAGKSTSTARVADPAKQRATKSSRVSEVSHL